MTKKNTTAPGQSTAVAVVEDVAKMTTRELVSSNYLTEQASRALPNTVTVKRFMRCTQTAFNRNPALWDCSKTSVASVILQSAHWGLEPDGRHAHIIPYKGEATLQLDYKGLVALVRRSGDVTSLHADVVCENDEFEYDRGEIQKHRIDFRKPRGAVYAVYATATMKDGSRQSQVMTREEVEAIRKRSRSADKGPWVTDWNEMAKKTVFKRLTKWLPIASEQFKDALEYDDHQSFGGNFIDVSSSPAPATVSTESLNKKIKGSTSNPQAREATNQEAKETIIDGDFNNDDEGSPQNGGDGDL
mgnify:CR=1 FL=1